LAAAVFAGLGVLSLSVRSNKVAEIKALFRQLEFTELQAIAHRALGCREASTVRDMVRQYLNSINISARDRVAVTEGSRNAPAEEVDRNDS
jgi:phosphoenolpyruvate-protein kinase (PTS system EI component)